jgi:endoglucanase
MKQFKSFRRYFYMIKLSKLVVFFLIIVCVSSAFGGPVTTYGNLKVQFSSAFNCMTICSQAGTPVQLRGMSSMGLQWYPVSALGVNQMVTNWSAAVVRAAMYIGEGGYIGNEAAMTAKVKTIVDAAIAKDIYVIIDWHILSDNNPKTNYSAAVTFFTSMSALYGNKPNVIWEICNEPNGATTWQDIKDYAIGGNGIATGIIDVIRNNDPDNATNKNIIIVGTPNWSQKVWLANADPINSTTYPNICYTFHFYASSHYHDFMNSPEWVGLPELGLPEGSDGIGNAADTVLSLGKIALFVTEWGVCEETGSGIFDTAKADQYVTWMTNRNISWTNWSLCNKGETASAFIGAGNADTGWNDATDLSASGIYVKGKILSGATPNPTDPPVDTPAPTADPTAAPTTDPGTPAPTTVTTAAPTTPPSTNLALNKTASSSTVQSPNVASYGNDGSTTTRWCASSSAANEWWSVDLGAAYTIKTTSVMWESSGVVYKYKVEISTNNSTWTKVVDKTANTSTVQTQTDTFTAVSARYVRITITTPPSGKWASLYEFTVQQ